jgi:hypothetical protein
MNSLNSLGGSENAASIRERTFGLGVSYYFASKVGDGFFLRAELGPADLYIPSESVGNLSVNQWGAGGLFGLGIANPWSESISGQLTIFYSHRIFGGNHYPNAGANVSILF